MAGADLVFSSAAAVAGVAAARALAPVEPLLSAVAVAALVVVGWHLWRSARSELDRAVAERSAVANTAPQAVLVTAGAQVPGARHASAPVDAGPVRGPVTLAAGFFAVTAVNPLTVVVFTSIVVGGAEGVGSPGWVLGMTTASLTVNFGFLAVGHALGAVLTDTAAARLRMGGALLVVALAAYLTLG